ncbi:hypothetical protein SAMN04489761_2133 [Tenacibaculum sp. MAR_2009_124]|uniref:hypothetical protein n=1 Tax=Tenacibaculum sp. MAR_2009_124 TaxID=1250059 RepID=UPI00089D53A0|nr:hypothetical protein [Tenacibaculum sp. MAR_2009_124]SEB97271.1 hypothetical protein SAMN04489761_2133 [Tenacibaculum sp. MAR_2009_124]
MSITAIKKGIGIHSNLPNIFENIQINSGVVHHSEHRGSKITYGGGSFLPLYIDEAYIPKRDWKMLSKNEKQCLHPQAKLKDHNNIYLGELPESVKKHLKRIDFSHCKTREDVIESFAKNQEVTEKLNEELNKFLNSISNSKPFHLNCITTNLPNLEMVACDISRLPENFTVEERKYMGLHNDGTKFMKLHTTYKFGNRICINLGAEARHFVYVNLSMIQVHNMLKKKMDTSKLNVYNVAECFFKYYPNYPVIKIKQGRYQYYIAPTDNCFHDGSTLGNTSLDINMVYFGNFNHQNH